MRRHAVEGTALQVTAAAGAGLVLLGYSDGILHVIKQNNLKHHLKIPMWTQSLDKAASGMDGQEMLEVWFASCDE